MRLRALLCACLMFCVRRVCGCVCAVLSVIRQLFGRLTRQDFMRVGCMVRHGERKKQVLALALC